MEKLQNWLREHCEENNLTWREASIKAGLNAGAVSALMSGQRPGLETCKKLAKLFRVSVVDVLYWAGHVERLPANDPIFYDSLFLEFAEAWPDLDLKQRRAFVLLAKKGPVLKAKRERGEE